MRLYIKIEAKIDLIPKRWEVLDHFNGDVIGVDYKFLFIRICYSKED